MPTTTFPLSQAVGTLTLSSITALFLSTEDSLVSLPRLFSLPIFSLFLSLVSFIIFSSSLPSLSLSLPPSPYPLCLLALCCDRCSALPLSLSFSPHSGHLVFMLSALPYLAPVSSSTADVMGSYSALRMCRSCQDVRVVGTETRQLRMNLRFRLQH